MIGAMWILGVLVIVGGVLYIYELRYRRRQRDAVAAGDRRGEQAAAVGDGVVREDKEPESEEENSECCGLHLVCEKDSLSPVSDEVIYYDDEELDRFAGRESDSYTAVEIEEFRDVLMTLRPADVAGWARSIVLRGLRLPSEVRDELLILVNEQRASRG